jgi:hypothetical protein
LKYPTKEKDISTIKFDKSNSPIVFSNRLLINVGFSTEPVSIDNQFFVSEITNFPMDMMEEGIYEEYCGQKSTITTYKLKYLSPYHFYHIYRKDGKIWKH